MPMKMISKEKLNAVQLPKQSRQLHFRYKCNRGNKQSSKQQHKQHLEQRKTTMLTPTQPRKKG